MSKIGNSNPAQNQAVMPWPNEAGPQVQQLRRAITAHMHNDPVKSDMAPMMSELLARLESFTRTERPGALKGPVAPDPVRPPSPAEASAALGRACTKLRHDVQGLNPDGAQRVQAMLVVLDEHLERKQEVVFRADHEGR